MLKFNCNLKRLIVLLSLVLMATSGQAEVIKEQRSLYRNILVEDLGNYRCLKFSVKRKKSSQSCINQANHKELVFDYTKFVMTSLVFQPAPKNVLIIGLGGGTLSNTLLELYPEISIDNVEIDPAVISVAKKYFQFKVTDKVQAHAQDGRIYIKRALRKNIAYDMIILDAFNGEYIPEHLLTKEFLEETKGLLSEQGVLVANTFSSSKLYHHESATYHAVFGDFYSVKKGVNQGNRIIIIPKVYPTKEQLNNNAKALTPTLSEYNMDLPTLMTYLQMEANKSSDYKVLTDQYSPGNLL